MLKVAVIGLGQFGQTVAKTLTEQGAEVLAIDKEKKIVDDLKDEVSFAVALDATNEETLEMQGIKDFDVVIVAIGERQFLANVLITTLLKRMGVPKVISRGVRTASRIEEKILESVGADQIVLPSVETAKRLAQEVLATNILSYIPVSAGYGMIKLRAPKEFCGRTIKELALRDKYKINLIGIQKEGEEVNYLPSSSDLIPENSFLYIIGKEEDIEKLGKINSK